MRCLIAVTTLLSLVACGGPDSTPEEELRQWVARGESAAEEKNRSELLDMISENYADGRGNDRKQVGDIFRAWFFRQDAIALLINIDDIAVTGDTAALIDLTVGMAGTNTGVLGFSADAYRFELELQKPDGEWQLIGARWGEFAGDLN